MIVAQEGEEWTTVTPNLQARDAEADGRVLTYEQLLARVWGEKNSSDLRPMRTIVSKLRRKLGEDAGNPSYIFTEPRMPRGETQSKDPPATL